MKPGTDASFLVFLLPLLFAGPRPSASAECANIDDPLQVLDLHLEMDPADWEVVRRDTRFEDERPALFRCGDETALPVMVRRKRSDSLPSEQDPVKVSLKIDFDDGVEEGEWHGHRKLSLESGVIRRFLPGALLREGVSWQVMFRSGAVAGGSSWVRVRLNDRLLGVYTRVEEIDKSYLRRRISEDEGFLYKFDPIDPDVGPHRRLTREGEPDPFLDALCWEPFDRLCAPPPDPLGSLKEHLNIHQLLTMGAVNTLLGNTDGLLEAVQNYYFYNSDRPRFYFPWDLDLTLLPENADRHPHSSEVDRQLFQAAPALRPHFDRALRRLCEETMADGNIDRLLDDIARVVGPAIEADPLHHLQGGFAAELERIRAWLKARTAFLRRVLSPAEPSALVINEVLASNRDTNRDQAGEAADWVEILNRSSKEASLRGLFLSNDPSRPSRWPLPDRVLPPGGRLLVWCDHDLDQGPDHAGFQLDQEGETVGLYEGPGGIVRTLDFVRFGPQETDRSIGRSPDGAALFITLPCPTPGLANDGKCPERDPSFIRGDCNGDTQVQLTDAVCLLQWLFVGGAGPGCLAAANVDGAGAVRVTDPVHLLSHLFFAGPPPPGPYPGCGPGTVEADRELGCAAPPESCRA